MRLTQTTTYLSNDEIQVIDTISKRMKNSRSMTIRRMLQDFMKVLQENGILDEDRKLNDE